MDFPTGYLRKKVKKALYKFQMIEPNETIVVGISGGIDSITMLEVLSMLREELPFDYNLYPVYISLGTDGRVVDRIRGYLEGKGYRNFEIINGKLLDGLDKIKNKCYWCSRRRRKILFEVCERLGTKKIALGHIKEDFAEAFLMNIMFSGETGCFNPKQDFFGGRFVIIRPMVYVERKYVERYARSHGISDISENCPYSKESKREVIRELIRMASRYEKRVVKNIFAAITNINRKYLFEG